VDWPLFAFVGGTATFLAWLVVIVQDAPTRYAGLTWLAVGLVVYVVYRRRVLQVPLRETIKAPPAFGPAIALEYRTIVVPVVAGEQAREAMHLASRLAAERRATIVAMRVIVIPLDLPVTAELREQEALADALLDEAHDIGDLYGVRVVERLVRGRNAGAEIVAEAERRNAEIVVMGAPRLPHRTRTSAIFGKTADYVLRHAPCRVMIAAAKRAAA
jgi:APA family basic amino acid/polyamine antiporter